MLITNHEKHDFVYNKMMHFFENGSKIITIFPFTMKSANCLFDKMETKKKEVKV